MKDQQSRDEFATILANSLSDVSWKRFREIQKKVRTDIDTKEISLDFYKEPNWPERQAHLNGYKQCLRHIEDLINYGQK